MRRPHHADPVGELERPGTAGAGDNDDGIAHAHGKMAALAGFPRQIFQHRGCEIDHLDFIERAGGERKQRPADAITFGIALLPHIAQRDHRFGKMERGRVVQADQLAEFGEPNALAMPRDLLEDRKRAAERLHAAALAILGVVVDGGGARLHQPRHRRLAGGGRLLGRLQLGSRFHGSGLHGDGPNSIRPSSAMNSMMLRRGPIHHHTTIAIDVQYYEK